MHKVLEEIIYENEWRNNEFAKFKINSTGVDDALWCRMCVPMIYAHWEGFVVSSMKLLINHLNGLGLSPSEISTSLAAHGLTESYKSLSGKQNLQQRIEFTRKFKVIFGEPIKLKNKVETKANLRGEVFQDICLVFGFNFELFKDCLIDIGTLVNVRNAIAHGENSVVPNMDNVNRYIAAVNSAIDTLTNEIGIYLDQHSYLELE